MPEGPETVRAKHALWELLFNRDHRWPVLIAVDNYGSVHTQKFRIEKLIPALGKVLNGIHTKGKHYFFMFEGGPVLHAHHGMSGYWSTGEVGNLSNVHLRMVFRRGDGVIVPVWWYNERFGEINAFTAEEAQKKLNSIAPALIGDHTLTPQMWLDKWKTFKPNTKLRVLLMSQDRLCSGIGNYLIAEIFYAMGLHPDVEIGRFGDSSQPESYDNILKVYSGCRKIMQEFAEGVRPKVIYKAGFSPRGNQVVKQQLGGRTFWWCPAEQQFC